MILLADGRGCRARTLHRAVFQVSPEAGQHYDRLRQRRDWLIQRVIAKTAVGWETQYDEDERDALTWALGQLDQILPKPSTA